MPYTERSKPQVVLNKMTKAVYDSIEKDPDQLYAVTDAEVYSLPTASANTLGGIKVGNNLSITEDGTLSAEAGGDAVYDTNGVNITDTTGTRVKIGNGANTYNNGVAIGVSAKAGTTVTHRGSVAIGNEAQVSASNAIAIGPSSIAAKAQTVSIGNGANSQTAGATAIGQNAYAYGSNSVALGTNSYAEYDDTVAVGDPGYEPDGIPSYYRKITCVEDGTDAHDAATVGQMPKERSLTQAEYDALSDEEKMNGTTYYITDSAGTNAFYVPTGTLLHEYGNVSSSGAITITHTGFLMGKAVVLVNPGSCYLTKNNDTASALAGIPYHQGSTNAQVAFCIPVKAGDVYYSHITSGCRFEGLRIYSAYAATSSAAEAANQYTADEQPVGTWIDGKTIYRKTVAFGTLPNATAKLVAHGITNLNYVVKIEGTCVQSGTSYKNIPLMYRGSDSTYNVEISVNSTDIVASSNQNRTMVECPYITIYYTKN